MSLFYNHFLHIIYPERITPNLLNAFLKIDKRYLNILDIHNNIQTSLCILLLLYPLHLILEFSFKHLKDIGLNNFIPWNVLQDVLILNYDKIL